MDVRINKNARSIQVPARTIVQQDGAYGGGTEWNGDSAHVSHWDDEDSTTNFPEEEKAKCERDALRA